MTSEINFENSFFIVLFLLVVIRHIPHIHMSQLLPQEYIMEPIYGFQFIATCFDYLRIKFWKKIQIVFFLFVDIRI